ncbi:DUF7697 family protein [Sphingomonas sp. AX6]|uniref:DUF7697 family protein n=1 Tax=Sphingomonas sp. AX6 TaxID=2653171 RepID=UPI0012F38FEB|nr:hypothetical protein [Sphingomonas sp. AX6]VXC63539.1 hypothetical protein SPHINGOAX6_30217 [Sphingomonas sp. AX6]
MGAPFALDFQAVMTIGEALGVDAEMLADVLPAAEMAIVSQYAGDHDGGGDA